MRVFAKRDDQSWEQAKLIVPSGSRELPSENARLFHLLIPDLKPRFLPTSFDFLVVACDDEGGLEYTGRTRTPVSGAALAVLATLSALGLMLAVIQYWVAKQERTVGGPFGRRLLYLLAGASGRVSLARSQVLFFSVIVIATAMYVFVRTGELSSLSDDILLLLGIGAVTTTAAGAGDATAQHRLAWSNWIWLKNEVNAFVPIEKQVFSLSDLITDGSGAFDIFRFQAVFFSLLTGASILVAGLSGLGEFSIPQSMLGILGLSQATYVGAKFVTPPTVKDFDESIARFRDEGKETVKNMEVGFKAVFGEANYNKQARWEEARQVKTA